MSTWYFGKVAHKINVVLCYTFGFKLKVILSLLKKKQSKAKEAQQSFWNVLSTRGWSKEETPSQELPIDWQSYVVLWGLFCKTVSSRIRHVFTVSFSRLICKDERTLSMNLYLGNATKKSSINFLLAIWMFSDVRKLYPKLAFSSLNMEMSTIFHFYSQQTSPEHNPAQSKLSTLWLLLKRNSALVTYYVNNKDFPCPSGHSW